MDKVLLAGEELNGLGFTLKQLADTSLQDPKVSESLSTVKGSLVVREAGSGVAVTLTFDEGTVMIQNGAIEKPSAYVEAGFIELADISSGQTGPIKALLTGKIKAGGNLLKLLKMSKIFICRQ